MARPRADQIEEQIKKQEEEFGETMPGEEDSMDIDEAMEGVTGNKPRGAANIAREVDKDEEALVHEEEDHGEEEENEEELPSGFHVEDEHNDIEE